MPKVVDHAQRREELAKALWRVIERDGIEQASVREVAAEAGWSTGALRHYFASQEALIAFAAELVTANVTRRIQAMSYRGDPREYLRGLLEQVLPMDEARHHEMSVWLAFVARARHDESLRAVERRANLQLRDVYQRILNHYAEAGVLRSGTDPFRAALRLQVFVDGLATHRLLDQAIFDDEVTHALLDDHLDQLFR